MSNYLIGIGGTGAKCIEAYIHLLAAGLNKSDTYVLMVDPDQANGSLGRTTTTIQRYQEIHSQFFMGIAPFKAELITPSSQKVWSPFINDTRPTFKGHFDYDALDPLAAGLMDTLYTPAERDVELKEGFLGRPALGAAVFADTVNMKTGEAWKDICNKIRNDNEARIFLVGSVFGGTGAAGLPTLARLLAQELEDRKGQIRLGCALMLPYFAFPTGPKGKVQAHADEFMLRSQAALSYYYTQLRQERSYQDIYILGGEDTPETETHSLGSEGQRNPPHYLELYAASAILDFFQRPVKDTRPASDPLRTYRINRGENNLTWESFPGQLQLPLVQFARFSYAYLGEFYPVIARQPGWLERPAWYKDFFVDKKLSYADKDTKLMLDTMATYCTLYLVWLSEIHRFAGKNPEVKLLNTKTYRVTGDGKVLISPDEYGMLYKDADKKLPTSFRTLSQAMDRARPVAPDVKELGYFFNALYKETRIKETQP